jgi:tRNA (mo5U34)-methyltransferase
MRFLPDPERFPMQGQPNTDRSNFWGFSSNCLKRMVEDIGFVVRGSNVRDDRVFIDAQRSTVTTDITQEVSNDTETRLSFAYGTLAPIPVNGNPDDPKAWTIF